MKIGDNEHTFNFQMQTLPVFLYDDALCIEYSWELCWEDHASQPLPVPVLHCYSTYSIAFHYIMEDNSLLIGLCMYSEIYSWQGFCFCFSRKILNQKPGM